MRVLEAHLARRSIRQYTNEPVADGVIRNLVCSAFAAPSAVNRRSWRLVVVTDRQKCRRLGKLHESLDPAMDAPLVFAVCSDPLNSRWIEDTSAMTENILNQCVEEGLGACWLAARDKCEPGVREVLGIPPEIRILCLVSVGHPAEHKEPRTQCEPDKAFHDSWGEQLPEAMVP